MIKRTPWTIFNVFPLMVLWLAMVVAGCSTISDDEPELVERVKVGDAVPSFTVNIVGPEGQEGTFSTTRLTGTTVIVFFNTSCKDCQRDLPLLNQYYLQHKDEPDFRMLAISREENEESVAAYWAANGLQIPYSPQEDRRIYNLFATSIIPRIYFIRYLLCFVVTDIHHHHAGAAVSDELFFHAVKSLCCFRSFRQICRQGIFDFYPVSRYKTKDYRYSEQ
jgi:thiol-disulfide isomerase/thioredoxin